MERRPKVNPTALITRRFQAGLSQTALAERVGCSKQLISGAERGKSGLSPEVLSRIADVFDCEVSELLAPEQDETPVQPAGSAAR